MSHLSDILKHCNAQEKYQLGLTYFKPNDYEKITRHLKENPKEKFTSYLDAEECFLAAKAELEHGSSENVAELADGSEGYTPATHVPITLAEVNEALKKTLLAQSELCISKANLCETSTDTKVLEQDLAAISQRKKQLYPHVDNNNFRTLPNISNDCSMSFYNMCMLCCQAAQMVEQPKPKANRLSNSWDDTLHKETKAPKANRLSSFIRKSLNIT